MYFGCIYAAQRGCYYCCCCQDILFVLYDRTRSFLSVLTATVSLSLSFTICICLHVFLYYKGYYFRGEVQSFLLIQPLLCVFVCWQTYYVHVCYYFIYIIRGAICIQHKCTYENRLLIQHLQTYEHNENNFDFITMNWNGRCSAYPEWKKFDRQYMYR
jgi:hypothetical protein